MYPDQSKREYPVRALNELGAVRPEKYVAMLAETPVHRSIRGLNPWFFPADPKRAASFCSEAAGRPVLPFAQAVGEDMMACFVPEPSGEPEVLVIDPWIKDKAKVVQARLSNYDAWLNYAAEISRQVQAREAAERDD